VWVIFFGLSIHPVHAAPTAQTTGIEIEIRLKNGESNAFPGQNLAYEIIVKNTSDTTHSSVEIQVSYLEGSLSIDKNQVKVVSGSGDETLGIQPTFLPNFLIINIGELGPNTEYRIEFSALVSDLITLKKNNITAIENTAELSQSNPLIVDSVSLPVVAFSIEKKVKGDGIIHNNAGEPIEMVLRVTNNTDIDFEEVQVSDFYNFPSSFSKTQGQPNANGITIKKITLSEPDIAVPEIVRQDATGDDYVLWKLGPMKADQILEISYQIEFILNPLESDKKLVNKAEVWASNLNKSFFMAQTDVPLEFLLEGPPPVMNRSVMHMEGGNFVTGEIQLGDEVQFTIKIVNEGGTPAKNVKVTDVFEGSIYAEDSLTIPPNDHNGRRDGSSIVWDISEIKPKDSIELKYNAKLKEGLFAENQVSGEEIVLTHTASISIDGIPQETTANSITFTVRKLLRLNDISIVDVNGAAIEPGDTLKVTIPIENKGDKTEKDIQIVVNYDLIENLTIENYGEGNLDQDLRQIIWTKSLDPGETSISFDLLLPPKIKEPLTSKLNVSISRSGTKLALTEKSITVVPSVQGNTTSGITGLIPSNQNNFVLIFFLVVALMISAFILLALTAKYLSDNNKLYSHMQDLIEMFTIVVIISTLLVLSMVTTIGENAAIGILSGIAGYVLGSRATRSTEVDDRRDLGQTSAEESAQGVQKATPLESQANIPDQAQKSLLEVLMELLADGETLSQEKLMDAELPDIEKINEVAVDDNSTRDEDIEDQENRTHPNYSENKPREEE